MISLLLLLGHSLVDVGRRLAPDIGTAFLGVSAFFFVRGFPETPSSSIDIWLMSTSLTFFFCGLFLRFVGRE